MTTASYKAVLAEPDRWLTPLQLRWLQPRGPFTRAVTRLLYLINWFAVRMLFRYSVEGLEHLPTAGPLIIVPNHASPLDPQLLGAGLSFDLLRHTYWAGKENVVLRSRLRRALSWYTRIVPIASDATALAPACKILEQRDALIWFPEGSRSLDGRVHEFKPGVAWLLTRYDVPVVPIYIAGAHAACPHSWALPRWRARVVVRIGKPENAARLGVGDADAAAIEQAAAALQQCVKRLGDQPGD